MTAITLRVEPELGQPIERVASAMWLLAQKNNTRVRCKFNGFELVANLADSPEDIANRYKQYGFQQECKNG